MNKKYILSQIKKTATGNGGKPLGRKRFEEKTGIKQSHWYGKIWKNWNDAVIEAGFTPNKMVEPYTDEQLLVPLSKYIQFLGHFPTQAELNLKRRSDPQFPPPDCFRRFGRKSDIATRVREFCFDRKEYFDVADICAPYVTEKENSDDLEVNTGYVYLLKHGKDYKIGKSSDIVRRYREIRLQMPMELEEVHVIETDDVSGIEAYWHNRFKEKRLRGEWFRLSPKDVKIFKRRKFM